MLLAGRLWLEGFYLLIAGNSAVQGIFGYTDAEYRLPALQTLTVIYVGAAVVTVWGAWKNHAGVLIGSLASVVIGTILIGQVWPSVMQRITVERLPPATSGRLLPAAR